jgi:ABC-2 type transport system permease protein
VVGGAATTVQLVGLSLLRGRRGVALALVCLLPLTWVVAAACAGGSGVKGSFGFVELLTTLYFARVNLFVALYLGCAALGEEIEAKTIPYLLVRPVPRSGLLLGRWLAGALNAGVLLSAAFLAAYAATVGQMGVKALRVDLPVLGHALAALWLSLAAYTSFFVLLSVVVRWPLLIGLALLFLWEEFAAKMPGTLAHFTLLHHVYSLLAHWTGEPTYQALASPNGDKLLTATQSLQVLAGFAFVSLTLALLRFRRRAYLV